jgi:integrase/recombinase XerD
MRMVSRLLYTEEEICRLLEAARNLVTPHKLQPWTYYCLFGLLAVSGMRLGEALNLQPQDANWSESLLTIRDAKFGKSRVVPLHSSTLEVLFAYAERRDQIYAPHRVPYFFVSSHGTRLFSTNAGKIFWDLSRQIGIREQGVSHGPRLHDFRHRFAVETLLSWYRDGEQVIRRMPVLSTYMGHGTVTGTYWYPSNTPELMRAASERLEARWKGVMP